MPSPVAVVRCGSYDRHEVEDALARALGLLEGAGAVPRLEGDVLLKPNFLYPSRRESLVCTDPEVVRAAAAWAARSGARVRLGDSPGFGTAAWAARASGVAKAIEGIPVEVVEFSETVGVQGRRVKSLELAKAAVEAGAIVNLAKFKTHGLMGLTLAVKNLFGTVPGLRKSGWHLKTGDDRKAFARLLADVAAALPRGIHVLDGVVAMEGNGPGSGTPRPLGVLLASPDPVALDRIACGIAGFPPREVPVFEAAREAGFGETDPSRIEVLGDDPRALAARGFQPAGPSGSVFRELGVPPRVMNWLRRIYAPGPAADPRRCRSCGLCVKVCPAGAVRMREGGAPSFDRNRCVRCLCCQEMCPAGAIHARRRFCL
jgi:uncharacterized protein (DUF362 family)/Pyruvate/2-oxoacid:ferredoxin oxidoreductase delta subunit